MERRCESVKTCSACGETKSLCDFTRHSKTSDGHHNRCKECKRDYDNQYYAANPGRKVSITIKRAEALLVSRQFVYDYLKSHPCVDCGETDPVVLQFDHLDPTTKRFAVASMMTRSVATILKEIAKCEVVCANCHSRRTAKRAGWYSSIIT